MYCPSVSVIIPVFNDARRLRLCLEALEAQTYPKGLYDVVVVDNASTEPLAPVVGDFSQARLVHEAMPGSYAARNTGIDAAQGLVLAFTDADCLPTPEWIERGVQRLLATPHCGLVAGKVELIFKDPKRPSMSEVYDRAKHFHQRGYLRVFHFGATANIFTFKCMFRHVGYFDAGIKSMADSEWGQRVYYAGYRQAYADDAVVRHPARTLRELYAKQLRILGGRYDGGLRGFQPRRTLREQLLYELRKPIRESGSIWKGRAFPNRRTKLQMIVVTALLTYGSLWEHIRLRLGGPSRR